MLAVGPTSVAVLPSQRWPSSNIFTLNMSTCTCRRSNVSETVRRMQLPYQHLGAGAT